MRRVHHDDEARQQHMLDLDEIARAGARRMLAEALEAEVEAYLEAAKGQRDEREDTPWSQETATPGSGRSSWGAGLWRSALPEFMTAG